MSNIGRPVTRRTALANLGAGALGLALATRRLDAFAQDATSFPMAGHPVKGVWRLDVDPSNPGYNISYGIFNEDGTYVAYHEGPGVSIGTWQPTGERSVELAFIVQRPVPQDLFAPDQVPEANTLESSYFEVWRLFLTIDESGTTMTSAGSLDAFDGEGSRMWGWDGDDQRWIRLILDPAVDVTPAS